MPRGTPVVNEALKALKDWGARSRPGDVFCYFSSPDDRKYFITPLAVFRLARKMSDVMDVMLFQRKRVNGGYDWLAVRVSLRCQQTIGRARLLA